MPLQDQQEFKDYLARRKEHDRKEGVESTDDGHCTGCLVSGDDHTLIGDTCLVCLAVDFGRDRAERRVSQLAQAFATAAVAADPHAFHRLLQQVTDRLEDAIDTHAGQAQT